MRRRLIYESNRNLLPNSCKYRYQESAKTPEEVTNIYHKAFSADYYLMSSNAISATGELVNIDGNGNRVAALIYGPKQVIILA